MAALQKYLIVKACAGLGNRLYTVTRAIEIAKLQNRVLMVDWADGQFAPKGVNAFYHFFDLENFEQIKVIPESQNLSVYPRAWTKELTSAIYDVFYVVEPPIAFFKRISMTLLPGCKMLGGYWINKSISNTSSFFGFLKNTFNTNAFPYGEHYYKNRNEDILVYVEFSPPFNKDLFKQHIKLKPQYIKKAEMFCLENQLKENSIGLHIRSTDKQPLKSIDFLLTYFLKKEFDQNKLFLATDSIEVENLFKKELGNRLIVYPKFLPETKGDGLHQFALYTNQENRMLQMTEESLMDMWILSKCERLYYQANSSFSHLAVILHSNESKCISWMGMN